MKWYVIQIPGCRSRIVGQKARGRGQRLPRLLALISLLIVMLGLIGWGWAKKDVTIIEREHSLHVVTYRNTVAQVLADAEICLGPFDAVEPGAEALVREGMCIEVRRAVPVTIRADGGTQHVLTTARSVGEVLRQCGIVLGPHDIVSPESVRGIEVNLAITVTRVDYDVEHRQVEVPCRVVRRPDQDLARGLTQVLQPGSPGQEWQKWQVVRHDGQPVSETLVERRVTKTPRNRVIAVGTATTVSRGGRAIKFTRAYDMRVTAYTYTGNRCATGVWPEPGIVAVDPRVIPLGTELYVENYGYARAMDTGGAIKGRRLDVFFTSRDMALNWGVRQAQVYVLG